MLRYYLFISFIVAMNVGYAALLIWLLRHRGAWPRLIGYGVGIWALLMSAFFLVNVFVQPGWEATLRDWFYLPLAVQIIWNVLFIEFLLVGLIFAALLLNRLRPPHRAPATRSPAELSRRKFLYLLSCGAAPATALGMGVYGTISRNDLRIRHLDLPIVNLPPELEGFTIAHVSDLHAGLFVGPERLRQIRDATNDLKPDLITITGDIINTFMTDFPAALAMMQSLESRHGLFLCEGNHDRIPGPENGGVSYLVKACWDNQLAMLYDTCQTLTVENKKIHIAGLPWMKAGFEGHPELVSRLFPARQEGDVRLLLAHHPHLFDIADSADVVLTGHTHGGQLMLGPIGVGSVFFKYWSGFYHRNTTSMVVSNGCGDWFPCRIGAPAEVGLLRLIKA